MRYKISRQNSEMFLNSNDNHTEREIKKIIPFTIDQS